MQEIESKINSAWDMRDKIVLNVELKDQTKLLLSEVILGLNFGNFRVVEKIDNKWMVHEWLKKAILLHFQLNDSKLYESRYMNSFDKIPPKYHSGFTAEDFKSLGHRVVPGAYVRDGSYIGRNVIIMPSFVNIGAYIGDNSLIDSWATIGSCAQIGKNCHISGGTGIGGVLEPLQNRPVIIEDNCFIGARSEIVEGTIVEEGAVIGMGVFIGASTKIVNRHTGEISFGRVPAYSVVVPGSLPPANNIGPSLYCAVIVKQVDESTRAKTAINELLRY